MENSSTMNLRNKIIENVFSMVSLKGMEYILNFVLLPYLLRVLGMEKYGAIVFMQGIVQYFVVFVDYGFNMTGPKEVARAKDKKALSDVFSNILFSKILILFGSVVIFMVVVNVFDLLKKIDIALFSVVFMIVIGNIFFPIWFFQGIQQMRYITIMNFIAKSIVVVLTLIFVREPKDYILAALFQSSTLLIAGILSIIVIFRNYPYVFVKPCINGIKNTFRDGWHIFISTIAINFYTTTNIVVLGMMIGNEAVGFFSAANKIIDSIKGVMNAVTQALYPYFSKLILEKKYCIKGFLTKTFKYYCGFFTTVSMVLFVFSNLIIRILFGERYVDVAPLLQLLSLLPIIISISNIFGIQLMINYGYQKKFSKILVFAALSNVIVIAPAIILLKEYGVAVTMVFTEALVTIGTYRFYRERLKEKIY